MLIFLFMLTIQIENPTSDVQPRLCETYFTRVQYILFIIVSYANSQTNENLWQRVILLKTMPVNEYLDTAVSFLFTLQGDCLHNTGKE